MDGFRSPKVVKLEQENEALKAMVNELNSLIINEAAFILKERFSDGIDDGSEERLRKCACRMIDKRKAIKHAPRKYPVNKT